MPYVPRDRSRHPNVRQLVTRVENKERSQQDARDPRNATQLYVARRGDRMTGPLIGPAGRDPVSDDEYSRKAYVDRHVLRTLIDAKGDLLVGTANDTVDRLPAPLRNRVLMGDPADPRGMRWDWLEIGGAAANRIQFHDHADVGDLTSDDGIIHFHSPEPESTFHGNLYQETNGTLGQRRAVVRIHPAEMNSGAVAELLLFGSSVDGTLRGQARFVAETPVVGPGWPPTASNHLVEKGYVDNEVGTATTNANSRVLRAGDTMTGRLIGPAGLDPASSDEYSRKAYVDARVLRAGDTMTGGLFAPEFRTGRDGFQKIRLEDAGGHAVVRFDSPDSNEGATGYLLQEMSNTFQHVLSLAPSKYNLGSVPYLALWSSTVDNGTKGRVVLEAAGGAVVIGAGTPVEGPNLPPTLDHHLADKAYVDLFLPLTGGTLSGRLIGPNLDPAFANEYTRQSYVMGLHNTAQANANSRVSRAGDTMTGRLIGPAGLDPTSADEYARKAYVDSLVAGYGYVLRSGDTMTGDLAVRTGAAAIHFRSTDATTGFWIRNDGANAVISSKVGDLYFGFEAHAALKHRFWTGGAERVRIEDGGIVMGGDAYINASRGLRVGEVYGAAGLYRGSGELWHAADGHVWRTAANVWLGDLNSSGHLTILGDAHANGFNVGETGEQRMEMHRHSGAWGVGTFLHFYAPGEMQHGNLYQDTTGTAGTTRRQRLWLYPSDMGWGTPQIRMLSSSEDGSIQSELFLDGSTWIKDTPADRSFLVGVGGNCRAVNAANTTWTPLEASEFIPVPSDPAVKDDIRPAPANMTADLRAVKVIRYRLRDDWDDGSRAERLGVDATSLPAIVQRKVPMRGTTITGYELGAMVAWLYGATQEIDRRLSTVEARP